MCDLNFWSPVKYPEWRALSCKPLPSYPIDQWYVQTALERSDFEKIRMGPSDKMNYWRSCIFSRSKLETYLVRHIEQVKIGNFTVNIGKMIVSHFWIECLRTDKIIKKVTIFVTYRMSHIIWYQRYELHKNTNLPKEEYSDIKRFVINRTNKAELKLLLAQQEF